MRNKKNGFTLVELAIVIVIIGFLVAGIAAGSSLIEQSKLRGIVKDTEDLAIAYRTFTATYNNQLPGDMANASAYFPGCAETQSRCNGNGDGIIGWTNDDGILDEGLRAMRHLNLAGLITKGGKTEIPDDYANRLEAYSTSTGYFYGGSNNNGYSIHGGANITADVGFMWFGMPAVFSDFRPSIHMASSAPIDVDTLFLRGSITGAQAHAIDTKIDDGNASAGTLIGANTGRFQTVTGQGGDVCNTGDVYDGASDSNGCITLRTID